MNKYNTFTITWHCLDFRVLDIKIELNVYIHANGSNNMTSCYHTRLVAPFIVGCRLKPIDCISEEYMYSIEVAFCLLEDMLFIMPQMQQPLGCH